MRRVARLLLAVSLLLLVSTQAHADATPEQREQARALANEGLTLFKKGDYPGAIDKFEKAEALVHAPPHVLYIARAQAKNGKLLAAREIYKRIVSEPLGPKPPRPFQAAQLEAGKELDALARQIPRISVEVEGAPRDATRVTVDGQEMTEAEMELDPGAHTIVGEAEGLRGEAKIDLALEARETVRLTLVEPSEDDDDGADEVESDFPFEPVILMAAGGALLVVAGVTGGLALNKAADLREVCPTNPCPAENVALKDEATRLATVSTTFFVLGGVATGAGAAWLIYRLVEDDSEPTNADEAVSVAPILAPGFVGLRGRFR